MRRLRGFWNKYEEEARRLVEAAFTCYENKGIGHAVARALYGNILSGSVTRLEQYAACAYAHFLQYGLELLNRHRYELAAADIGNLFHDSIDMCFKKVKEEGRDWRAITDEERVSLVKGCGAGDGRVRKHDSGKHLPQRLSGPESGAHHSENRVGPSAADSEGRFFAGRL